MGEKRGQRNRDQDRYWHERRRAEQFGLSDAALVASAICFKCGGLTLREQLHKGWCLSCVATWVDSADPWLIYQAKDQLPRRVVPGPVMKQVERLAEKVAEPITDDEFLPLTQFMGSRSIGDYRSLWNFIQALYTFEIGTTSEAAKLGLVCPNTVHLCGRHAPVARTTLQGFLSRVHSAKGAFNLFGHDRHLSEFVRGFVADNRMLLFTYNKTGVDVFDRARSMRFVAKYGKTHFDRCSPSFWPFESEHEGKKRESGELEELPDFVMQIGQLVPTEKMPATLREDLCQDLCVAVLTGETTVEALRNDAQMRHYIREVFKNHPLKYGRYSLDQPSPHYVNKGEDYMLNRDMVTHEDTSTERAEKFWMNRYNVDQDEAPHGWHEGRDREKGLASLGDIARLNNGGYAIEGPNVIRSPEEIDEDIAEVFFADQHPQWRRRLSD
jgi:hypothetical protein